MKKILFQLIAISFLLACSNSKQEQPESAEIENKTEKDSTIVEPKKEQPKKANYELNDAIGFYVGMFEAEEFKENKKPSYANKINISIDSFLKNKIYGHSIVAGNDRPFIGSYEIRGSEIKVEASEPGDDKYDGTFKFNIYLNPKTLQGAWSSFNKSLAVTERSYNLIKRSFKYNRDQPLPEDVAWGVELYESYNGETGMTETLSDEVLKFNASNTLLNKTDIENLYQGDLEIIRNAIYARHGYSFKNRRMRYVFDSYVDWYIPVKTNILADLTELEKKNIDLLKRYEKHAEKYYDTFGR